MTWPGRPEAMASCSGLAAGGRSFQMEGAMRFDFEMMWPEARFEVMTETVG